MNIGGLAPSIRLWVPPESPKNFPEGLLEGLQNLKCGAYPGSIPINETIEKLPYGTFSFVIVHGIGWSFRIIMKPVKSLLEPKPFKPY